MDVDLLSDPINNHYVTSGNQYCTTLSTETTIEYNDYISPDLKDNNYVQQPCIAHHKQPLQSLNTFL